MGERNEHPNFSKGMRKHIRGEKAAARKAGKEYTPPTVTDPNKTRLQEIDGILLGRSSLRINDFQKAELGWERIWRRFSARITTEKQRKEEQLHYLDDLSPAQSEYLEAQVVFDPTGRAITRLEQIRDRVIPPKRR